MLKGSQAYGHVRTHRVYKLRVQLSMRRVRVLIFNHRLEQQFGPRLLARPNDKQTYA